MSSNPPPIPPQPHPKLDLPDDLEIEYVNLVRISHSPAEIIFDLAQLMPGTGARIQSRVVMSPLGAKLMLRALADNLSKFETKYGEIKVPGDSSLADYLFKPPDTPPEE